MKRPNRRLFINDFLEYSFFSSLPDRDQKFEELKNDHSVSGSETKKNLIERKFFDLLRDIFDSSSSKWKSNHGHDEMTN